MDMEGLFPIASRAVLLVLSATCLAIDLWMVITGRRVPRLNVLSDDRTRAWSAGLPPSYWQLQGIAVSLAGAIFGADAIGCFRSPATLLISSFGSLGTIGIAMFLKSRYGMPPWSGAGMVRPSSLAQSSSWSWWSEVHRRVRRREPVMASLSLERRTDVPAAKRLP